MRKEFTEDFNIYNEDRSQILDPQTLDFTKGHIVTQTEIIHHEATKFSGEIGHYETLEEYPNGGKDVVWVTDIPGTPESEAYDEQISYHVFIEYTQNEILIKEYSDQIQDYKQKLNESDYLAIKYSEGWIDEETYTPIKRQRQEYRDEINALEDKITELESE